MSNCHVDLSTRSSSSVYLDGPADLVSAVPYLLGFTPRACLVAVFMRGVDGELVLTARVDHPEPGEHTRFIDAWASACELVVTSNDVDRLVLVDFCERDNFNDCRLDTSQSEFPNAEDGELQHRRLTAAMAEVAQQRGVYVCDEVMVVNDRWRSVLCEDFDCCPADGSDIDADRGAKVAAPFVAEGIAPLANREQLGERLKARAEGDPQRLAFEQQVSDASRAIGACDGLHARRDLVTQTVEGLCAADASMLPTAIVCLRDMRRRDAVLRILIHDVADESRRVAEEALMSAIPLVADADIAQVATVVAGIAWQRGDGALASQCLARALASDPDYSLARLLSRAIRCAVPPTVWVDAVKATTVEGCLIGS